MRLTKYVGSTLLGVVCAGMAWASPSSFVTHNHTPYQSNVAIFGKMTSHPTPPGTESTPAVNSVPWIGVKFLCGFKDTCIADLYVKSDTANPVFVGQGTLNLSTGEITPAELRKDGFRIVVDGPGQLSIYEDK